MGKLKYIFFDEIRRAIKRGNYIYRYIPDWVKEKFEEQAYQVMPVNNDKFIGGIRNETRNQIGRHKI